jgi:hypothetical protein
VYLSVDGVADEHWLEGKRGRWSRPRGRSPGAGPASDT